MTKIISLFILALGFYISGHCQDKAALSGRVLEKDSQKPLVGATVTIRRLSDSSQKTSTISSADGWFRISAVPLHDSLLLEISYTGYEAFHGLLLLNEKKFVMQPVLLRPASKTLAEVIVLAKPPLMVIKGDTMEFKASNLKTPPNSMAEDLIQRIPGLTVNADGKMFFNGRPISTILVDGRPLFSPDGNIALKNIPVDLIDKIQLADTKTAEEELRQEKASGNNKTLNID